MKRLLLLGLVIWGQKLSAQPMRWQLCRDKGIRWTVEQGSVHNDHIEMAGKGIAIIVAYGVDKGGRLVLNQHLVFPGLRKIPNDTRGSYSLRLAERVADSILVDGRPVVERPDAFYIKGILNIVSRTQTPLVLQRTIFPSIDKRAYVEQYVLTNTGSAAMNLHLPVVDQDSITDAAGEVQGISFVVNRRSYNGGDFVLMPGNSIAFSYVVSVRKTSENKYICSALYELKRRESFVNSLFASLGLQLTLMIPSTGFLILRKLRAAESIYDTKAGLMHGPGGGEYYAAIWANDQAEYTSPFFPFLGDASGK